MPKFLVNVLIVLVALGQFLCASGSGNPQTVDPLPDVINTAANLINVIIGVLIFIPRTRALSALSSILITFASIFVNYAVDGIEYFLKVLPFDLALIFASVLVFVHCRKSLFYTFKSKKTV